MSEHTSHPDGLDFAQIDDSILRRALRTMHQQMTETLARQQMEIDAMLEILLEKHITSLSEFKRQLVRLQQDTSRSSRLHSAMAANPTAGPGPGTSH